MWKKHESPATGFKSIYLSKIINRQEDIIPEKGYFFTKPISFSRIRHDIDSMLYSVERKSYHPIMKDGKLVKVRTLLILYSALYDMDEDAEYLYAKPIQHETMSIGYQFHKEVYLMIGIFALLLGGYCLKSMYAYTYIAVGLIFMYMVLNN
jgi:hypothetical protein